MATLHLAAGGSNTAPYDTWAKAATTLATALAGMSAGDVLYIDKDFSESVSSYNVTIPGTAENPCFLISGTPDTVSGITAVLRGATFTVTTNVGFYWAGNWIMVGLKLLTTSSSTTEMRMAQGPYAMQAIDCEFTIGSTAGGSSTHQLKVGATSATSYSTLSFYHCTFRFASSNAATRIAAEGHVRFIGGGFANDTSATPTRVVQVGAANDGGDILFQDFDFSPCKANVKLIYGWGANATRVMFARCKLPATWDETADVSDIAVPLGCEIIMHNCANTTGHNYRSVRWMPSGNLYASTAHTRSGGASDGTTALSWRVDTNSKASQAVPMYTPWMTKRNADTGSARTVSVEILHDSATDLHSKNAWVEVSVLDDAGGFPLGELYTGRIGDLGLAAGTDHANSGVTWTNTGSMTNPNKQTLVSPSFTPRVAGLIAWRVGFAPAPGLTSKTVYVDYAATIA